jgi:hypothetical protein
VLDGLSPALTCVAGDGGVRSSGSKPKGRPFHPGVTGEGEDRTGESREPPLMPRDQAAPQDGMW